MRIAVPLLAMTIALLAGCKDKSAPSAVQQAYENRADAIDNQAAAQPTEAAKKIYESRADAVRDEGKDRKEGLEKAGTKTIPPMPEQGGDH
jgi:DNA-binding SARP family transcriptional activator